MPKRSNEFQQLSAMLTQLLGDGAVVEESKMLTDRISGEAREVDVVGEGTVAGHKMVVSIEVREHRRPQGLEWIEQVHNKHSRLPTNLLILVSKSGFTQSALDKAASYGIKAITPSQVNTDLAGEAAASLGPGPQGLAAVERQFIRLRWGVVRNPVEHGLEPDLWLMARDSQGFDLGALVGAQVKSGDSWFRSPEHDETGHVVGWWFHDSDGEHFKYWKDHHVPHILVLHDLKSGISYWVHLTPDRFASTGTGSKILVPADNTIDEDHFSALLEVATGHRKPARPVFVSYVRDDSAVVDQLCADLKNAGVPTWRDNDQLLPGDNWKLAIRRAIENGTGFIACFSRRFEDRSRSYMYEELVLAIEQLRQRPADSGWFMPVLLDDAMPPDIPIGAGLTLRDLHFIRWQEPRGRALKALLAAITRLR
jgi:hypothetical protein